MALETKTLPKLQLSTQVNIIKTPNNVSSDVTSSFWLTNKYIPNIPKATPINDFFCSGFLSINLNKKSTNSGCVEANRAPKPLSTYRKAQTKTPLPYTKKKNEAIIEFKNCFLEIFKGCFNKIAIKIIKKPATENRIDAKKKGGNSVTATLLNK